MSINHHPSDAMLVAYGSGSLSEGLCLVVASHLAYCHECRNLVSEIEAMGGNLLEDLPPTELGSGSYSRLLARALNEEVTRAPVALPKIRKQAHPNLPQPLRGYVEDLPETKWRWMAPGIRQIDLGQRTEAGGSVRLLRIAPGVTLPHHGHAGAELTLVLEGSFSDEVGRFKRGDLAELDTDTRHQPVADTDVDCVCLIATEAPLRFSGLVGRLIQPIIGL